MYVCMYEWPTYDFSFLTMDSLTGPYPHLLVHTSQFSQLIRLVEKPFPQDAGNTLGLTVL